MTTHVALITTTINVPHVLAQHVNNVPSDVELTVVVAGDVQTPVEARRFVELLGGTYLGVDDDLVTRWSTNDQVGVRSIQRRNVALLHALTLGPDVVVTIDDDNSPTCPETYVRDFVGALTAPARYVTDSLTGWYNPACALSYRLAHDARAPVYHRGFPLDQRDVMHDCETRPVAFDEPTPVGVAAGLWLGDPDVDALDRLVLRPRAVDFSPGVGCAGSALNVGTWAPFNTQNTAYRWEVAPLMQCLVGVGRYDDIWASYVARRVMDDLGWYVAYGEPLVVQDRNDHDLVRDLQDELLGYRRTPELIRRLRALEVTFDDENSVISGLESVYRQVADLLPSRTVDANGAWLEDVTVATGLGRRQREERT